MLIWENRNVYDIYPQEFLDLFSKTFSATSYETNFGSLVLPYNTYVVFDALTTILAGFKVELQAEILTCQAFSIIRSFLGILN
jgi:hypothetical protein